jgi:hypothetical protein
MATNLELKIQCTCSPLGFIESMEGARRIGDVSADVFSIIVERASGNRQVVAAIDQRDETALLKLLEVACARAV